MSFLSKLSIDTIVLAGIGKVLVTYTVKEILVWNTETTENFRSSEHKDFLQTRGTKLISKGNSVFLASTFGIHGHKSIPWWIF